MAARTESPLKTPVAALHEPLLRVARPWLRIDMPAGHAPLRTAERTRPGRPLVIRSGCRDLEAQPGVLRRAVQRLSRGGPPKE